MAFPNEANILRRTLTAFGSLVSSLRNRQWGLLREPAGNYAEGGFNRNSGSLIAKDEQGLIHEYWERKQVENKVAEMLNQVAQDLATASAAGLQVAWTSTGIEWAQYDSGTGQFTGWTASPAGNYDFSGSIEYAVDSFGNLLLRGYFLPPAAVSFLSIAGGMQIVRITNNIIDSAIAGLMGGLQYAPQIVVAVAAAGSTEPLWIWKGFFQFDASNQILFRTKDDSNGGIYSRPSAGQSVHFTRVAVPKVAPASLGVAAGAAGIATQDGQTIAYSGDGTNIDPLTGEVIIDPDPANALSSSAAGLFAEGGGGSLDGLFVVGSLAELEAALQNADFKEKHIFRSVPELSSTFTITGTISDIFGTNVFHSIGSNFWAISGASFAAASGVPFLMFDTDLSLAGAVSSNGVYLRAPVVTAAAGTSLSLTGATFRAESVGGDGAAGIAASVGFGRVRNPMLPESFAASGFVPYRYGVGGNVAPRTIAAAAGSGLSVANGNGIGGNPTIDSAGLSLNCDVQTAITNYTFDGTERRNSGFAVDTAGGDRVVNCDPDLFAAGFEVIICKFSNDANIATIDAGAGNNIDGAQTYVLRAYMETITLVKDGASTWKIKSSHTANPLTTFGDLMVGGDGGKLQRLGIGAAGQSLKVVAGIPNSLAWGDDVGIPAPATPAAGDLLIHDGTAWVRLARGANNRALLTRAGGATEWAQVNTLDIADGAVNGSKLGIASQAQGDLLYFNGTIWERIPKGSAAQVLTMNGAATAPEWAAGGGGSSVKSFCLTFGRFLNGWLSSGIQFPAGAGWNGSYDDGQLSPAIGVRVPIASTLKVVTFDANAYAAGSATLSINKNGSVTTIGTITGVSHTFTGLSISISAGDRIWFETAAPTTGGSCKGMTIAAYFEG
jgi:hypothetical protein